MFNKGELICKKIAENRNNETIVFKFIDKFIHYINQNKSNYDSIKNKFIQVITPFFYENDYINIRTYLFQNVLLIKNKDVKKNIIYNLFHIYNSDGKVFFEDISSNDFIFETFKEEIKINKDYFKCIFIDFIYNGKYQLALKFFIKLKQNDLLQYYLPFDISNSSLAKKDENNKSFLDYLTEYDKESIIYFLPLHAPEFDNISNYINNALNIDDNKIINEILEYKHQSPKDRYYAGIIDIEKLNIPNDGKILLNKMKDLFLSDGISNKNIIDCLIRSYGFLLQRNYGLGVKEIMSIIDIKLKKDIVYIENSYKTSCFGHKPYEDGTELQYINCNPGYEGIIFHETTHAIDYNRTSLKYPQELIDKINMLQKNEDFVKAAKNVFLLYNEYLQEVYDWSYKYYEQFYNEYDYKIKSQVDYLNNLKDTCNNIFKNQDISSEISMEVLSGISSLDEFIDNRAKILENEICQYVDKNILYEYDCITDILDAIFGGIDQNNEFKDYTISGYHGSEYYSSDDNRVSEMIAQFGTLLKSPHSEMLEWFKEIVGDDLYNCLYDFYYNTILNCDINDIELKNSSKSR